MQTTFPPRPGPLPSASSLSAVLTVSAQAHAQGLAQGLALAVALALALALAGCAPTLPPLAAPAPDLLPARYAEPAAAAAQAAGRVDWREFFIDPTLRELIGQALAHNTDQRLALLRVEEARAAHGITRAERWPGLGAAFEATRTRVPADLNLTGRPLLGDQFQLGVGISQWELDLWGRVRSLDDAALKTYLAADATRRAVSLSLIAQVAQSYLSLCEIDERLMLAQRSEASRQESLRIFRRREALGATSKLELTQVELLWQQAHGLVLQLSQARATQAHALELLVGSRQALPPRAERLGSWRLANEVQAGLPSALLAERPDIAAAELALGAAEAQVSAARAAYFPRIALTASGGTASAELNGLFQPGSSAWAITPSISLPLFDGGRRDANLELSRARREQALVRYEQSVRAAFRDVSDALSARQWLAEQVATLDATLAVQTERARLATLRYESGAARYLEVLDAQRDLLALEQQAVQTRRAQLAAEVALYAALGGGAAALPPISSERPNDSGARR